MVRSFLVALLAVIPVAAADARPVPENFSELAARLSPAVVNISAERAPGLAGGEDEGGRAVGSGFIIDPAGLIVTNSHVIDGATDVFVGLADGNRRIARVVGTDPKSDIALLRIEAGRPLPALPLGNSDEARPGDWVLAIGNPFGFGGSVSAGIISARNRQLDAELYDDFIQTDAAINRGSSGGPLFNADGDVVGVNASLISPNGGSAGVSFAIPSNTVRVIVAQLRRHGAVRRGWIGANVQDLTPDLARAFGLASPQGALVAHVSPGGPAALAGLAPGDVVIAIGEQKVSDSRSMQKAVVEAEVGRELKLLAVRKGVSIPVQVRVARRAENVVRSGAAVVPKALPGMMGIVAVPLSDESRARAGLGVGIAGVAVSSVVSGSPAAEAGIKPGDVILEAGHAPVRTPVDLRVRLDAGRTGGSGVILVVLSRGGERVFGALRYPDAKVDKPLRTAGR